MSSIIAFAARLFDLGVVATIFLAFS